MKYRISADKLGLTTYTNSLQKAFQIFVIESFASIQKQKPVQK